VFCTSQEIGWKIVFSVTYNLLIGKLNPSDLLNNQLTSYISWSISVLLLKWFWYVCKMQIFILSSEKPILIFIHAIQTESSANLTPESFEFTHHTCKVELCYLKKCKRKKTDLCVVWCYCANLL